MSRITLWLFVAVTFLGCLLSAMCFSFFYLIAGSDPDAGITLLPVVCVSPVEIGCGVGAVTLAMNDTERKFNKWERALGWASGCLTLFGAISLVAFFY